MTVDLCKLKTMNPHLEKVLKFIQKSQDYPEDAKNDILKALHEADEELKFKDREIEIESGLENVRSRAIAMRNSSDLTEAAGTVFTELYKLGINPIRSGFVLLTHES